MHAGSWPAVSEQAKNTHLGTALKNLFHLMGANKRYLSLGVWGRGIEATRMSVHHWQGPGSGDASCACGGITGAVEHDL